VQAKESAVNNSSSVVCKATMRPRTASEGSKAETPEAPKQPAKKKKKQGKVEASSLPEVRAGKRERSSAEDEDHLPPKPKTKKRAQKDGVRQAVSEVSKESRDLEFCSTEKEKETEIEKVTHSQRSRGSIRKHIRRDIRWARRLYH
jgi:La-related protein 7